MWSRVSGLTIHKTNMWKRRKDLHNSIIRGTAIKKQVLLPQFDCKEDGKVTRKGFLKDLMYMLAKEQNFPVILRKSVDKKFGAMTKYGSFNGMVGMIARGKRHQCLAHDNHLSEV